MVLVVVEAVDPFPHQKWVHQHHKIQYALQHSTDVHSNYYSPDEFVDPLQPLCKDVKGNENNYVVHPVNQRAFEVVSKPLLRPSDGVRPFLYTSQVFNLCVETVRATDCTD